MSDLIKLARPYAKAAFETARDKQALADWSSMLQVAAQVIGDSTVQGLTSNPHVAQTQVAKLVLDLVGDQQSGSFANLLDLLAENRRLSLLPQIAEQYEHYRREEEKRLQVKVVSAVALSEDQQSRLQAALARRFDREVAIDNVVDTDLIGGAVIYAGDLVIDGTVRGRLQNLATNLAD